jgi:hypothetical protein
MDIKSKKNESFQAAVMSPIGPYSEASKLYEYAKKTMRRVPKELRIWQD